jgi:hypothetical protein
MHELLKFSLVVNLGPAAQTVAVPATTVTPASG